MPSCRPKRASSWTKSRTGSQEKATTAWRKRVRRRGKPAASLSFFLMPRPCSLQLRTQTIANQLVDGAVRHVSSELRAQPLLCVGVPCEALGLDLFLQRTEDGGRQARLHRLRPRG